MTDYERLKILRKFLNIQQGEFALSLGLKQGSYSDVERGRSGITYSLLQEICSRYGVNPSWVLFGQEPMILSQESKPNSKPTSKPNSEIANLAGVSPVIVTVDEQGRDNIVLVDVKAAAGYISHRLEPTFIKELPAFKLPGGDYRNASYRGFEIEGDSMYDTLAPGDWVISRLMTGGPGEIRDGYVHVIVTQTDILVKRCVNRTKERGRIVCISDNEAYPAFELPVEDILEVWFVRKLLSGHLPARNRELKLLFTRLEAEVAEIKLWKESLEANRKSK